MSGVDHAVQYLAYFSLTECLTRARNCIRLPLRILPECNKGTASKSKAEHAPEPGPAKPRKNAF
jgi:hypothetical protein